MVNRIVITMKLIDTHIHMYSRTVDDYERMSQAGIVAVVEPAFWLGIDRNFAESFFDYFLHISTFEPKRASTFNIKHFCALAVNPKEANNRKIALKVIEHLPEYLKNENVIAIGEVGFDKITDTEEEIFLRQMDIAEEMKMPVIIHTPHQQKLKGVERICSLIEEKKYTKSRIVVDHNTPETYPLVRNLNTYAGFTLYPGKISIEETVAIVKHYGKDKILVNSSADWGRSDPLVIYKMAVALKDNGFDEKYITQLLYHNPYKFFSQSEKFKL